MSGIDELQNFVARGQRAQAAVDAAIAKHQPRTVTFDWDSDVLDVLIQNKIGVSVDASGITVTLADNLTEADCRQMVEGAAAERREKRLKRQRARRKKA